MRRVEVLIVGFATLLFVPFLGGVHLFDWDEINFAEIAREMLVSGDWLRPQVGFFPFYEKPPLFAWLQAASMQVFDAGEFAARLPNAICGVLVLWVLFRLGRQLGGERLGWLWAGMYAGSTLPHFYFRSGIIDPWFNAFIFLGLYGLWRFVRQGRTRQLLLGGLSLGLAVLAKGPVAWLVAGLVLCAVSIWERRPVLGAWHRWALAGLASLVAPALWFGALLWQDGPAFLEAFIRYQLRLLLTPDAGHSGFAGYHFVVLLVGCFPASVWALSAFGRFRMQGKEVLDFRRWMLVLFWVVLILFSLVRTKIVHYSSLCYYPISFLAALAVEERLRSGHGWPRWQKVLLWSLATVYLVAALAVPLAGQYRFFLEKFIADPFARACLEAPVVWGTFSDYLPAAVFSLGMGLAGYYLRRNHVAMATGGFLVATGLFVQLSLYCFIGKIEAHSQRAAIEYCKRLAGQDVYLSTIGFKSYAPYFYGRVRPGGDPRRKDQRWLLEGEVDRPVWFIAKIQRVEELRRHPNLELRELRNGFALFERVR